MPQTSNATRSEFALPPFVWFAQGNPWREFGDLPTPVMSRERYIALAFTGRKSCERSSLPGRRRRTERWKFEAVARIVRLLDTIKAPGSPGHLSRPSDKGKVVDPNV